MKKITSVFMTLSLLTLLSVAAAGAGTQKGAPAAAPRQISDTASQEVIGKGGFWSGVGCGLGIVGTAILAAATPMTGGAATAGVYIAGAATIAACAAAISE